MIQRKIVPLLFKLKHEQQGKLCWKQGDYYQRKVITWNQYGSQFTCLFVPVYIIHACTWPCMLFSSPPPTFFASATRFHLEDLNRLLALWQQRVAWQHLTMLWHWLLCSRARIRKEYCLQHGARTLCQGRSEVESISRKEEVWSYFGFTYFQNRQGLKTQPRIASAVFLHKSAW